MDLFASDRSGHPVGATPAAEPGSSPPPARAPRAGDLSLDDWEVPRDRMPPRRWLAVAAVAPWLVVAVLLGRGMVGGSAAPTSPTVPASSEAPPTPGATATPASTSTVTPSSTPPAVSRTTITTTATAGTTAGDRGQAVGLAVAVARSWLSTHPSPLELDGIEPSPGADTRYLEHLAVESVDHPARGALVVTVRAVVLPIEGRAYGAAEVVRAAVPVRLTDTGPRPGGPPWWLPTEDAAPAPPTTEPVDDPDLQLAAVDAVTAAGYADVQLEDLERTEGWAWVAHVRARAPGQEQADAHAVWLRTDVGRFVVAGTPPPRQRPTAGPTPRPTSPSDQPTSAPTARPEHP